MNKMVINIFFNYTIKILFSDERKIPARLPNLQKGRLGLEQEMRYNNQYNFEWSNSLLHNRLPWR
jgi:hypothetical protein